VLADSGTNPADNPPLLSLVTQLGADPVITSPLPGRFPTPAQFPLATARPIGLVPAELAASTVAAAAHDLVWDAGPVTLGLRHRAAARSYLPALRQLVAGPLPAPSSVRGRALAGGVGGMGTARPDRNATLVKDPLDLMKITVTVAGHSAGWVPLVTPYAPVWTRRTSS
jgi:hypothetical protein